MAAIAWIKRIVEIIGNLGNLGGQVYSKIVDESITLGMVRDRGGRQTQSSWFISCSSFSERNKPLKPDNPDEPDPVYAS